MRPTLPTSIIIVFGVIDVGVALYLYFTGHTIYTGLITLAIVTQLLGVLFLLGRKRRMRCSEYREALVVAVSQGAYQGIPVYYASLRYQDNAGQDHEVEVDYAAEPAVKKRTAVLLKPGDTLAIRFNPINPKEYVLDRPANLMM